MPLLPSVGVVGASSRLIVARRLLATSWQAPAATAAANSTWSTTMGQKSIDSFLIKKPDGTSRGKVMASTAAGGPGDGAAAATGEPQAVVAAAGAGAGVAPAAAEQPADVHQAQAIEQQHMRAHANRNAVLAKQVGQAGTRELLAAATAWRGLPGPTIACTPHESARRFRPSAASVLSDAHRLC